MGKIRGVLSGIACLLVLYAGLVGPAQAKNKVTLILTNAQGTVVATADSQGNVTYTAAYRPYGKQQVGTPQPGPGYTGHVNDPDTGLIYMRARYYDQDGLFLSVDPATPTPGNIFNFNRYTYANDNPIYNIDPDGRAPGPPEEDLEKDGRIVSPAVEVHDAVNEYEGKKLIQQARQIDPNYRPPDAAGAPGTPYFTDIIVGQIAHDLKDIQERNIKSSSSSDEKDNNGSGNKGGIGTIYIDKDGNAIITPPGGSISGSPDGTYIQARDADGKETGVRKDGGHRSHADPRAQQPHAHVPGVTNPDGTPWLPLNQGNN